MIYEEVQRSGESGLIDNGWGSSEFESYDEQSDSETKQTTRNKVQGPYDVSNSCSYDI